MNRYQHKAFGLIFSVIILWASPVFSAETEPAPSISARFKALSVTGVLPEGLDILVGPAQRLHLNVPSTYIESAVQYNGPADIAFVKPQAKAGASKPAAGVGPALPPPEIVASVTIPQPSGDYLLLFASAPDAPLKVLPVPFSTADAPLGSCLVWNLTSRVLGVSLGGQRELMKPQARQLFRPAMMAKDYIDLKVFDEYESKPRLLTGGPHYLPAQTRQLFFIVERIPGQAPVLVKVVAELPETPVN